MVVNLLLLGRNGVISYVTQTLYIEAVSSVLYVYMSVLWQVFMPVLVLHRLCHIISCAFEVGGLLMTIGFFTWSCEKNSQSRQFVEKNYVMHILSITISFGVLRFKLNNCFLL